MRKLEEVLQDWEAVIGLEIHAELTTLNTKMFCGCKMCIRDRFRGGGNGKHLSRFPFGFGKS